MTQNIEFERRTIRGHHLGQLAIYNFLWNRFHSDSLLYGAISRSKKNRVYGEGFVEFEKKYKDFLVKNPNVQFTVICGLDTLCNAKSNGEYLCNQRTEDCLDIKADAFCINELGLSSGQSITIKELAERVEEYDKKIGWIDPHEKLKSILEKSKAK